MNHPTKQDGSWQDLRGKLQQVNVLALAKIIISKIVIQAITVICAILKVARLFQLALQKCLERVQIDRLHLSKRLHPDRRFAQRVGFQFAPFYPATLFL